MAVVLTGDACGPGSPVAGGWGRGRFQAPLPPAPCNMSPGQAGSSLAAAGRWLWSTLSWEPGPGDPGHGVQHGAGRAAGRGFDSPAGRSQGEILQKRFCISIARGFSRVPGEC